MTSTRYLRIAEQLAEELAGQPRGQRVASEPELAERFDVSRAAARSALRELERRLLVRRVRGAGTFVNRRIDYVISHRRPPSWHATVAAAGATPRSQVKSVSSEPLPESAAARLDRPAGSPAHRVVRHFFIDDLLGSWTEEWIAAGVAPGLELGLHTVESIDEVLRQMGRVCPTRAWCRVSVDFPPPEVADTLRLPPGALAWRVESLSRDRPGGRPLMCSGTWSRTDAIRVVVELEEEGEQE